MTTARHLSLLIGGGVIDTNGFSAVVGDVVGDGTLTKIGPGTLILSGASTHAGGTTLAGGTLVVNGTHTASPLYVSDGTLRGSGSLGTVTMGSGVLAPGANPSGAGAGAATAIMHAAQVTMEADVSFVVELNGTVAGTGYDRLDVSGAAAIGGATLKLSPSFLPATGTTFTILTNATGKFAGLDEGAVVARRARFRSHRTSRCAATRRSR